MQTLTVKLPSELSEKLNRRARELNRPKSEIVRQALQAQFGGGEKAANLLERAGDLVGKYAGSKHSSDKRNLKTLGIKSLGRWKQS